MRTLIFLVLLFLAPLTPVHAFSLTNFDVPESFILDPEDGAYYVSNINGTPTDKDGNGYISRIGSNGKIVIQKFIGGQKTPLLDAPKGLVVSGKYLVVTDIDSVKAFNKKTRRFAIWF